ncbi:MAG: hypothetical protein ACUVS6_13740 [Anaerolineae bacterium]
MTAPSVRVSGSGFRYAAIYALDSNGYPAATSATVYEGIQAEGARTLELNEPEPRIVSISGDDRLYALDVLPATEGMTGTLTIARANMELEALTRAVNSFTLGEARGLVGGITDKSGNEPQCALLAYRQALTEVGARVYESLIMPRVLLLARHSNYTENAAEYSFSVVPQLVTKHLWGAAFSPATEGVTQAQVIRFITQYKPRVVAWKGDNSTTKFLFASNHPAVSVDKIHGVWVNGVLDSAATKALDGVTPTQRPGNGDIVVCFYEVA